MKKIITLLLATAMIFSLLFAMPALGADALIATGSDWKYETSSHISSWGNVKNAFDGDKATHWHTFYRAEGTEIVEKDEAPHTVTVTFPKEVEISGWQYTPRQDNSAGTITAYNIYGSKDGKTFEKIYSGTFGYEGGNAPRPVESAYWEKTSVRAVKIEVTEAIAGYGSAAEIQFYGSGPASTVVQNTEKNTETVQATPNVMAASLVPAENLKLSATFAGKTAQNAVDGKEDTYFTTGKNSDVVEVTLAEETLIAGFSYTPREDSGEGIWTSYTVYGSADGENFIKLGEGSFDFGHLYKNRTKKVGAFGFQAWVTKLRFSVTTPDHFISAAEIGILVQNTSAGTSNSTGTNSSAPSTNVSGTQTNNGALSYDASWKIETSSHISSWGNVKNAFDGDKATHWHTFYRAEGTEVVEKDEAPHTVTVTFPKEVEISGWRYTPRQDNSAGTITAYNIYGSKDGKTFEKIYSGTFGYAGGDAPRPVETAYWGKTSVRAVKIEVTESIAGYGSGAEFEFLTGGTNSSAPSTNVSGTQTNGGALSYDASWKIETSSHISSWGNVKHAFDGDKATHWHTFYRAEGTEIVEKDEAPHTVTVTFPKEVEISGWRYTPRQDNSAGTITAYNIYGSKDGKTFEKIYSGTFGYEGGDAPRPVETAYWEKTSVRAVKIEVTESIAGYGSGAEFEFLTGGTNASAGNTAAGTDSSVSADGFLSYDTTWKVTTSSNISSWGNILNAFDGDEATCWHTYYTAVGAEIVEKDEVPFTITVNFPRDMEISGWQYIPRSENPTGTVLEYTIYTSTNGTNFEKVYDGSFPYENVVGNQAMEASWNTVTARAVKLEVTQTIGGFGVAAEIRFKGGNKATSEEYDGYASDGTPKLARKNWKIEASSKTSWGSPTLMLDGNVNTSWHTYYRAEGATVVEQDTVPHTIDLTLPSLTTISGFSFLPRAENSTGRLLNYELYVSDSLDGDFVKLAEYTDKDTTQEKEHIFTANIDVRRVRFVVTHAIGGYGVAAELYLLAENPGKDKISYAEFEKHDAEHRLYEIDNSLFTAEQNGEIWSFFDTVYLFDGAEDIPARWFQTEIGKDFILVVDMKDVYRLKEIEYVPRQSEDLHGHWTLLNVSYSTDGITWVDAIKNLELNASLETKKIVFDEEITARYIEFDIMKSVTNRISGHELKFYQTKEAKDAVDNGGEKYVLTVGKNEIEVTKGNETKTITLDAAPYIVNGTTLIPLRGLLEEMGKSVSWDGNSQTISVDNGAITLQIHNRLVYVEDEMYGRVRYTLLAVPVITDDRTFIPVRFVSEQLGYNVTWNGETGEIVITK